MPSPLQRSSHRPTLPVVLWAGVVAVVALLVGRFWIPLDDGTLAQSAERVLGGQLPHRDFGDPYSGLNAVLGAAAFKVFGVRLMALRIPLVVGFALWLPAVWSLARRFLGWGPALAATALAATLSVLAYPAAMPTWYDLFLVTWGCWLLLRWMERPHTGLLVIVGVAAGVAVLFKVVGLYFLAAAYLTVAWRRRDETLPYALVTGAGVAAFLLLLGRLVLPGSGPGTFYHFFVPALAVGLALVGVALPGAGTSQSAGMSQGDEPSQGAGTSQSAGLSQAAGDADARGGGGVAGLSPLFRDGALLTVGAVAPVALFLVPYAWTGSVASWVEGVFLLPGRRFQAASSPPGSVWTLAPGLVAVAVAWGASALSRRAERRLALGLAGVLAAALALDDALDGMVMASLWYSARGWIPALTLVVSATLVLRSRMRPLPGPAHKGGTADGDGRLFAILAASALWALVQFPYAAPAYFFYVAPMAVLATAAAAGRGILRAGPVLGLLAGVYLFLGAGYVFGVASSGVRTLETPRGDVRVSLADARVYDTVLSTVSRHLDGGTLWAGPDAPEVYFLAGTPNLTPTLYEFLDAAPRLPETWPAFFRDHDTRVIVLNTRPLFSGPLDPASLEQMVTRFPQSRTVGHFIVRWRER